jgi:hypothetical protein
MPAVLSCAEHVIVVASQVSPRNVVDREPDGSNPGPVPSIANRVGSTKVTVKVERKDPCACGILVK